jgi:hypothetical protein
VGSGGGATELALFDDDAVDVNDGG